MSIAEKLTTVAENQQKVYDAGKQAKYDRFWDVYQDNGNRTDYICAFSGIGWTEEILKPKYSMRPTNAYMMFRANQFISNFQNWLDELGITIDFSKSTVMQYVFSSCKMTEVGTIDCSSTTNIYSIFDGCTNLKTIGKLIIKDGTTMDYAFGSCTALENITVEGVISKNISLAVSGKVTHDSLMSVINALKDYSESSTTYKLTLHEKAKERLSEADIAIASQKGWTIA